MRIKTLLAVLAAGTTLTSSLLASADTYTYVDLGTLSGADSGALGVNDLGQVVGWATVSGCTTGTGAACRHAFLWDAGSMTDLGHLAGDEGSVANSINNAGTIVGNSERDVLAGTGTYHAVIWNAVGPPTALPDLGMGTSWASDINEAGVVVGYATDAGSLRDRVVTWSGGAITNMGSSEPHEYNRGLGLNDSGQLIGMAWDLFSPADSVLFDGTNWNQIGGFGQFENSEGYDLNNSGRSVGTQAFPSGNWSACIWDFGAPSATNLGVLPGHSLGYLLDVNEAGNAVGYSLSDAGAIFTRGIYTDGTTLTDVNDLLPAGTNAIVWDAMEINENGDIVGAAEVNGHFRAYMLKKNPADGNYCSSLPNSTGQAAVMSQNGSTSIAVNNFELVAQPVPDTPFLFFYGPLQISLPFGDGIRCVGGPLTRITPATNASGNRATRIVDLAAQGFAPGEVNFQCWFRDVAAGGAGFNTSDGYHVTFVP